MSTSTHAQLPTPRGAVPYHSGTSTGSGLVEALGRVNIDFSSTLSSYAEALRRLTQQENATAYWKGEYESVANEIQEHTVANYKLNIELLKKGETIQTLQKKITELEQVMASQSLTLIAGWDDRLAGQWHIDPYVQKGTEVAELEQTMVTQSLSPTSPGGSRSGSQGQTDFTDIGTPAEMEGSEPTVL